MSSAGGQRLVERGSIAPLVPIIMIALFLIGGLLVDGSRDLNARGNAQAFAEEAARAGATAIKLDSATLELDTDEAAARVAAYCAAIKGTHSNVHIMSCKLADPAFTSDTTCGGASAMIVVNTTVELQIDTTLLGMVGYQHFTVSGAAKARPYEGTNAQNRC